MIGRPEQFAGQTRGRSQAAGVEGLEADRRIDVFLEDQMGRFRRDLLDVHAAFGRGHEHRALAGAIDDDAQIKFLLDAHALLDQHAPDRAAFGPGLVGDQIHADDLVGKFLGFRGTVGASLTPPPLPRPPAWICALTTTVPPRRLAMS